MQPTLLFRILPPPSAGAGVFSRENRSGTRRTADKVDCSRGDMIVKSGEAPSSEKSISATVCQVNSKALKVGEKYILQHGVNRVLAKVDQIQAKVHTDFSGTEEAEQLKLNDIGKVNLRLSKPIHFDSYHQSKSNGAFILIDEGTFDTVSVGFIE